jgi:hypothetical protein
MSRQLGLFESTGATMVAPLTEKEVENKLFGEVLDLAHGNVDAVGTAVRKVLRKWYFTYVHEKGRWIYLANRLTRRAVRAIRGAQRIRRR